MKSLFIFPYRVKWILVNGTKYNLSSVLIIGYEDDLPKFGKVSEILVTVGSAIVFEVNVLYTETYDLHYHAYIIKPSTQNYSFPLSQVLSFHPLTLNILNHVNFIVLKYHIVIPYSF